ncbi:MAG: hypothetical protein VYD08_02330 [Pseudomonadota bacterium]|nr:hypothetical protein [Pseudomonadota bacterium]
MIYDNVSYMALLKRKDGFCLQVKMQPDAWEQCDGFIFGVDGSCIKVKGLNGSQDVIGVSVTLEDKEHLRWLANTPLLRVECISTPVEKSIAFVAVQSASLPNHNI